MTTTTTTTTKRITNNKNKRRNRPRRTRVVRRRQITLPRKRNNRTRRIIRRIRRTNLPIAYTTGFQTQFRVLYQSQNTMMLAGRDLIYQIPDTLEAEADTNVITVIPCNPAYWTGTRIATIAAGYQNYRPLHFRIHYVPKCASTQSGNIIGGTLWDQVPTRQGLQQSLKTSSGNILTQVFKPAAATVQLKTCLQTNLYRIAGKFDQLSNPFIYIAISVGAFNAQNQRIIPGYFYVDYRYVFKNPIGAGTQFFNSGIITYDQASTQYSNSTLFTCSNSNQVQALRNGITNTVDINIGTILQQDYIGEQIITTYNDSQIKLPLTSYVWQFSNTTLLDAEQTLTPIRVSTKLSQNPQPYTVDSDVYVSYNVGFFFFYYLNRNQNKVAGYLIIPTSTTATAITASVLVTLRGESPYTWYRAEARADDLTIIGAYHLKTSGSFLITELITPQFTWILIPPSSQTSTSKGLTQKRTPNIGRSPSLASGSASAICETPYLEQANAHRQQVRKSCDTKIYSLSDGELEDDKNCDLEDLEEDHKLG